jgi:hypothetical protein
MFSYSKNRLLKVIGIQKTFKLYEQPICSKKLSGYSAKGWQVIVTDI